ncbi:MAG: hypothetical protein V4534_04370 [Myxococcota bacterium]
MSLGVAVVATMYLPANFKKYLCFSVLALMLTSPSVSRAETDYGRITMMTAGGYMAARLAGYSHNAILFPLITALGVTTLVTNTVFGVIQLLGRP